MAEHESKHDENELNAGFRLMCTTCKVEVFGEPLKHIDVCSKIEITCEDCKGIMLRENKQSHDKVCPRVIVFCVDCDIGFAKENVIEHKKICLGIEVRCNDCGLHFARKIIDQHKVECKLKLITCKWCLKAEQNHVCDDQPEICLHCRSILKLRELGEHLKKCDKNSEKEIKCDDCYSTYKMSNLDDHRQNQCISAFADCVFCRRKHDHVSSRTCCGYDEILCDKCEWMGNKEDLIIHQNKPKNFAVGAKLYVKYQGIFQPAIIGTLTDKFMRVKLIRSINRVHYGLDKVEMLGCIID